MEELEKFKKKINSYLEKALNGGVSLTNFLDEAEMAILNASCKKYNQIKINFFGGFINSDRNRAIINCDDYNNFQISVFKIIYNKRYYSINHRSILGSLMSLGIKRECIGDIVCYNDDYYFSCVDNIADFLINEFHQIGKANIEIVKEDRILENIVNYEEKLYFIPSLRLDVIVGYSYNLSRSEALDFIKNGLVYVNHILNQNPSYNVKKDDEISVRHKGIVKLKEIGGLSKSGRQSIILAKRI